MKRYGAVAFVIVMSWLASAASQALGHEGSESAKIRLHGRVVDSAGSPQPGVTIRAGWLRGDIGLIESLTDDEGRYRLTIKRQPKSALSSGGIIGAISPDGRIAFNFIPVGRDAESGTGSAETSEHQLDLELKRSSELKIRVTDEDGNPIENARLQVISTTKPKHEREYLTAKYLTVLGIETPVSDHDGIVKVPWIQPAQRYQIVVQHDDYARETSTQSVIAGAAMLVSLKQGRRIDVQINCESPEKIEQADVTLERDDDDWSEPLGIDATGHGFFLLKPREGISISVKHPALVSAPQSLSLYESHDKKSYTFNLVLLGQLHGRVIDETTSEGAANVGVMAVDPESNYVVGSGISDSTGQYTIKCPAIECRISIGGSGAWDWKQEPVHLAVSAKTEVEVPLLKVSPKVPVRGKIVDTNGQPIEGVIVMHHLIGEPTLSQQDGSFELARGVFRKGGDLLYAYDVEGGRFGAAVVNNEQTGPMLSLAPPGHGDLWPTVDEEQKDQLLTVTMHPTCSVSATVTDANGNPIKNIVAELSLVAGYRGQSKIGSVARTVSSENGSIQFDELIEGKAYRVSVQQGGEALIFEAHDGLKLAPVVLREGERLAVADSLPQQDLILSDESPPELNCQAWFNSDPMTLEQFKGKTVLLNFWGTWCGPCKRDLPWLRMLDEKFRQDQLVVIGVHSSFNFDKNAVEHFIDEYKLAYPIAIDSEKDSTVDAYRVTCFPTILMIDRTGKLHHHIRRSELMNRIQSELTAAHISK